MGPTAKALLITLALCSGLGGCASRSQERIPEAALEGHDARLQMIFRTRDALARAGMPIDGKVRAILDVMAQLPREDFVPAEARASAYQQRPLPIGHGQTISDPFIVAYMTRRLDLRPGDRVLEIGTGSGYQAAVLGSLVQHVYTIEIVPELAQRAAATLRAEGFGNVEVRQGDGYAGWPEAAPFDAIIVTAGAAHVPTALFAQLRPGGRMIIPLGPNWAELRMTLVRKTHEGRAEISGCGWVLFVPFVGTAQTRAPGAAPVLGDRERGRCSRPLGPIETRVALPPS